MYGKINSIVLSRAGESDNVYIRDEESVQEDGLCEVKIVDNQIMNFNNRSDYLQGLLAALDGLSYYKNDFNSTGILYYEVGDMYYVTIGDNSYKCLMLNDEITVTTGIEERIYTDLPEQSQTDYSKADKTDRRINQTYIIVDKQNQTISSVVSSVDGQNSKISQINQRLDGLESSVQDIADITTYGESQIAVVNLSDINESEPIMLKVRPITKNISRLYPKGNLYPSNTQYLNTRIVNFKRTYTEEGVTKTEDIPYELPDDLLYYDSNYYDEFYLDYDSQTCQITKRCEYSGGVNNIVNPADIINRSDIGGISSITYDETETFKVIFDNEDGGQIGVYNTYFKFVSDSITISLQNLVNMDANNIRFYVQYFNGDTRIGVKNFEGSTITIHNNDIQGNIANRWNFNLAYYNTIVNQEYRFNLMVNTGTTALPFETFNAIVVPKDQEQVIDYPYPAILLRDGDYEISLAGYDIGYLFVRLMAQNIYTGQFATRAQVSSKIEQTAQDITTTVAATYERKDDAITNYSELRQTATSIQTQVNNNNQSISTLEQTANSLSVTVQNNNTKANIIAKINDNTSMAQIEADSISLAGKTINLTGDNVKIQSTKFSVDKNGNMTCSNANITGGKVNVSGSGAASDLIRVTNSSNSSEKTYIQPVGAGFIGTSGRVDIFAAGSTSDISMIDLEDSYGVTSVRGSGIRSKYIYDGRTTSNTPNMQISSNGEFQRSTNTSSKRYKEKIQEISNETLNPKRLYDMPIIQFRYKEKFQPNKNDSRYNKDLIGFIAEDVAKVYPIATDYNENGEVENWNERYMIPAMLKLIQEQHIEIEQMKKEIEELKGGNK